MGVRLRIDVIGRLAHRFAMLIVATIVVAALAAVLLVVWAKAWKEWRALSPEERKAFNDERISGDW